MAARVGGTEVMRARWEEPATLAVTTSALLGLTLLPLLVLTSKASSLGAERVLAIVGSPSLWALLFRSIIRSGAVTVFAVLLGVPLGFLLGRTDAVGRRAALVLHAFPMFLPPFVLALGWFHLLGRQGLAGSERSASVLFSSAGLIFMLGFTFTPVVTVLTALGLAGIDPSFEEAGRAVAAPGRVATRILLPMARPSIALGALVVFALSLSELGVPMFLRVETYPAVVFARLGGISYSPGEAFALTLPLLAVSLVLLSFERTFIGRRSFTLLGLRRPHEPLRLGRLRNAGTIAAWLATLLGLLPFAVLALQAGLGSGFREMGKWLGESVQNGLTAGAAGATLITLLGIFLGRNLARGHPGSWLADGVSLLSFITPAAVLGVGLIALWNHPITRAVYGSSAIVVLGYVGRYAIMGVRPMAVVVSQSSPHLEEAAAASGARFLRRLFAITVRLHWRSVAVTWLLALVFCLRDIETAILFYPPGKETLPIRIFTLEANGPEPVVAALSVLHVLITATVLAVGLALLRRDRA